MKDKTLLPTTQPIKIQIKNITDKMYENISVFDYKKKTNLIYSSILEPVLMYEDILRFLTSMRLDDKKQIGLIYIRATSLIKENETKQLLENSIIYTVTEICGATLKITTQFPEINPDVMNGIRITGNIENECLFSRCNLLIGKLYPYTTIDILIYPSEETKFF